MRAIRSSPGARTIWIWSAELSRVPSEDDELAARPMMSEENRPRSCHRVNVRTTPAGHERLIHAEAYNRRHMFGITMG